MRTRLRIILTTYRKAIAAALGTLTPAAVVAVCQLAGWDVPYGWAVLAAAVLAPLGVGLARRNADTTPDDPEDLDEQGTPPSLPATGETRTVTGVRVDELRPGDPPTTVVGEHGPELDTLPGSGRVVGGAAT